MDFYGKIGLWGDRTMDVLILLLFILVIISLNVAFFILFRKEKLNLIVSGIIMMIVAPVLGFLSGALFLHFYDWSSGGTGECWLWWSIFRADNIANGFSY